MKSNSTMTIAAVVILLALAALYFSGMFSPGHKKMMAANDQPMVNVSVPELGQVAKLGEQDFNANCASCHGKNAAGSGSGPPLIHIIYEPNHHADFSFVRAVKTGVQAHHWKFGNMPPQEQVEDFQLARIVTYVRTLQKANGIF